MHVQAYYCNLIIQPIVTKLCPVFSSDPDLSNGVRHLGSLSEKFCGGKKIEILEWFWTTLRLDHEYLCASDPSFA